MDYAVLGDSVILAQRLESAAPTGRDVRQRRRPCGCSRATLRVRAGRRAHAQGEERGRAGVAAGRRAALPRAEVGDSSDLIGARPRAEHDRGRARASAGRARWCRRRERRAGVGKSRLTDAARTLLRGCGTSLARRRGAFHTEPGSHTGRTRSRPTRGRHPPTEPPRHCRESARQLGYPSSCGSLLRPTPRTADGADDEVAALSRRRSGVGSMRASRRGSCTSRAEAAARPGARGRALGDRRVST